MNERSIEKLLNRITDDNLHAENAVGRLVGNEVR